MKKTKRGANGHTPIEHDDVPRMTITLTDESVYLTRHDRTGVPAATYPVTAASVANAFNLFGASTGLLPPDTLFWSARGGVMRIGVWLPPARRAIHLQVKAKVETLTVPLPGLMFVGQGTQYTVFALTERPTSGREMLYMAPLPNVNDNGAICSGNVKFPVAGVDTMAQAAGLFFESLFNNDLVGGRIRSGELLPFLRKIERAKAFPIDQLVAANVTVGEFISGARAQSTNVYDGDWGGEFDEEGEFQFDPDVWGNDVEEENED
jgi:PRTRC genetic system protein B